MPDADIENRAAPHQASLQRATPDRPRASGWKLHTPNALVVVRLLMTVAVVALLSAPRDDNAVTLAAVTLFILAALTDALDGFLARRWNAITTLGRIVDPLADKILVLGTLIVLAATSETETSLAPWMVVVIITRELLVTTLRAAAEAAGRDFSATSVGKAKMVAQSLITPALILISGSASESSDEQAWMLTATVLSWTLTLVTAWSAFPYLFNAYDALTGGRYFPKPTTPDQLATHNAARSLTVHGFGLMRPFPGTWGSLPPVLLTAALAAAGIAQLDAGPAQTAIYHAILAALCLWGCWSCLAMGHIGESAFGKKDPGQVVSDEVAGMCIALVALPITLDQPWWQQAAWIAGAFFTFRFFDIVKLPPANQLQKLPGGAGILVDDLVAGLYALITLQLVNLFL